MKKGRKSGSILVCHQKMKLFIIKSHLKFLSASELLVLWLKSFLDTLKIWFFDIVLYRISSATQTSLWFLMPFEDGSGVFPVGCFLHLTNNFHNEWVIKTSICLSLWMKSQLYPPLHQHVFRLIKMFTILPLPLQQNKICFSQHVSIPSILFQFSHKCHFLYQLYSPETKILIAK